jgi:hypothetical protein
MAAADRQPDRLEPRPRSREAAGTSVSVQWACVVALVLALFATGFLTAEVAARLRPGVDQGQAVGDVFGCETGDDDAFSAAILPEAGGPPP